MAQPQKSPRVASVLLVKMKVHPDLKAGKQSIHLLEEFFITHCKSSMWDRMAIWCHRYKVFVLVSQIPSFCGMWVLVCFVLNHVWSLSVKWVLFDQLGCSKASNSTIDCTVIRDVAGSECGADSRPVVVDIPGAHQQRSQLGAGGLLDSSCWPQTP